MVEEMLVMRDIEVSYKTVRHWALKFGQGIARRIRFTVLASGDKWYLDEMVITMCGRHYWLGRAVDQRGAVLDVLVQSHRGRDAATRLICQLPKKQRRTPRVLINNKPKSYPAANKSLRLGFERRQHKGLNNRAENSHQPIRVQGKVMRRFKSARQLQHFASVHDQVGNLFMHFRYNRDAAAKQTARAQD